MDQGNPVCGAGISNFGGEQGLAAGERAGRGNEAPGAPHGGAGGAAGQAAWRPRWTRAAPSCSSYFLDPDRHWVHPEHALQELQNGGGDAPAPAHEA